MHILGIDPAPAKKSVVFDGNEFFCFKAKELKEYIYSFDNLLIGWDGPLDASLDKENFSLTIRPIEKFFNRLSKTGKKIGIPEGINTLGFASCSHWSISQYVFSLPIVNETYQKSPWKLLVENNIQLTQKNIVETHPALSIWLMLCGEDFVKSLLFSSWKYKGNKEKSKKRLSILKDKVLSHPISKTYLKKEIKIDNDDKLDAYVSWLITKAYYEKDTRVGIFGDKKWGAFLLYLSCDLVFKDEFKNFISIYK
ncbi:DUF429 domain-containing protein [Caminibacter mediatlanticus TB-2]|uniref:DUF429 domain-containing protein n=1 Tax=Caminibacter mediatlanticus TB-2 TaxID=391592 RepID=A0ABX5VAL8_9BACT|nr:DUF429 domain-containing protein [Caminibacter mediatlanticus]QCT95029.1 DUF429 domain-containing protein [Caminibacter mediatlanticus TB-2]